MGFCKQAAGRAVSVIVTAARRSVGGPAFRSPRASSHLCSVGMRSSLLAVSYWFVGGMSQEGGRVGEAKYSLTKQYLVYFSVINFLNKKLLLSRDQ